MIRQAITCDICASEKRQTNHWFVAYEQGGELRVSGWNSRYRLRAGAKHLCGQTCLHKLVDEFMAKSIAVRAQRAADDSDEDLAPIDDTSLTSAPSHAEIESSARLLAPPEPSLPHLPLKSQPDVVTMPPRPRAVDSIPFPAEPSRTSTRHWRAEAWERERERELRAAENRPDIAARRRPQA